MKTPIYELLLALVTYCTLAATPIYANRDYLHGKALYQHGRGDPANFPEAFEAFQAAANENHADAQFYLGRMYQLGHGTELDIEQAAIWYKKAGMQDEARAWNNLANIYNDPEFSEYSETEALHCYQRASDLGMAMGSYNLALSYRHGNGLSVNFAEAERLYRLALQQYPNYPGAWIRLGRLYELGGHGIEQDLKAAEMAYRNAAMWNKNDQKNALYYLADLYYENEAFGTPPATILRIFSKAAELGSIESMSRLGWIYNTGYYGTVDQELAMSYFEPAAAQGDDSAQNQLAILLVNTNKEAYDSQRVLELYAASAKQGNIYAMNNYGRRIVDGDVPSESIAYGIELLKKAASNDYLTPTKKLAYLVTQAEFQPYFTEQEIEEWTAQRESFRQQARTEAKRIIDAAAPELEQANYDEAIAIIDAEHLKISRMRFDRDEMASAYWWEAQTIGGRADPEWGWRLFTWLKGVQAKDSPNELSRLVIYNNISNSLIECGRIAQMRQLSQEAEAEIRSLHGLEIMPPADLEQAADYTFPAEAYTSRYTPEMLASLEHQNGLEAGAWIRRAPMIASMACAEDQLSRANWRESFFIAGQVEHWAREVLATDTLPIGTHHGWMVSNLSDALILKAEAYELLGLHSLALDCYNQIIDENMNSYGGRHLHAAIARQARLLVQQGKASEVDLAALQATIQPRRDNKFENRDAYQFTQLAYAHVLHALGQQTEAWALINQILTATQGTKNTFLRIEALRVQIECSLAEGQTSGTEAALLEILELARSKGLNNLEPGLYELYAHYLAQSGQLQAAQRIQQKAIDRLQGLQMEPRLASAFATLDTLRNNDSVATEQDTSHFNLQPSRITSAPLPGQGSIAVFSLSNLKDAEADFQLRLNGQALKIVFPQAPTSTEPEASSNRSLAGLEFHLLPAASANGSASQTHGNLAANEQQFIHIHAPASVFENGDQQLDIRATIGGVSQQAELILLADAGAADIAVIDAIELIDNPYYLVPAFHSIARTDDNLQSIGLRAIASHPTRIEAYNTKNELLFIDAEGNGSFNDPGDLINCELAADLSPILQLDTNPRQVEFRYQPHSSSNTRVDIEIQTRNDSNDSNWDTQVIDWIQSPQK
jgi:TPR repeat protein